ncbi:hypothetical protein [Endozoicomonas sp.]|uniref:hypothetical protein n=1 Tax=Endozoicomonas sp. TaxID=1892382 RepID=UPI003AF4FBB1
MKSKLLVAATALAVSAMAGVAQADLAAELAAGKPTAESLAQAAQTQGVSVESLIGDLATQFQDQPALLQAIVSEAIKAFPEQASQIVYVAVTAAPAQKAAITTAATAQLENNPEAQKAVQEAADSAEQTVAQNETGTQPQGEAEPETEAEQSELPGESEGDTPANETPAPTPPPPPPPQNNTPDKPPAVSDN